MKSPLHLLTLALLLGSVTAFAQPSANTMTATVDGKTWSAPVQKLNLAFPKTVKYFGLAGMAVKPDVQLWLRFLYSGDKLKPAPTRSFRRTTMRIGKSTTSPTVPT